MRSKILIAFIAAVASLVGAFIGALASILTTKMHLDLDQTKLQVYSLSEDRRRHQEKAESLLGEVSDLISFFERNSRYEKEQALSRLGAVRRAAFEMAPYSSPQMTFDAISAVDRISSAIAATNPEQLHFALNAMERAMRDMIESLHAEDRAYVDQKSMLLGQ
ncbi:hypothetical protein [Halomonas sp. 18071143]|uniref:hypothetical protein n=1 Tax=Halomonas sp. 18071143 TaxID=2855441 RepID=UPI001C43B9D3|nr:hypothetical protein [Halomonas sp. 18071143]